MASNYGLNFGFRHSDESSRRSEGRFKTPVGSSLRYGTAVEIDAASAGYLKQSAADVSPLAGVRGLLLQEEDFDRSIYETSIVDSHQIGLAKADRLSVITGGAGVKVWFKNTAEVTRADGRVVDAVDIVDFDNDGAGNPTTLAVGTQLGWSGTAWVEVDGVTITNAVMEIVDVDTGGEYLEAVLLG